VASDAASASPSLQWTYEMPEKGTLYAYAVIPDDGDITIVKNGEEIGSVNRQRPYIFCCGSYDKGELLSLRTAAPASRDSGNIQIYVSLLSQETLDKGWAALKDEGLMLTEFAGTRVTGHILVNEAGLLYTSLPWEKGWRAYVDGRETAVVPLNGSMAMIPLTPGEHEIGFRFVPPGWKLGLGISACALLAFILLVRWDRRRPKPQPPTLALPEPQPPPTPAEQPELAGEGLAYCLIHLSANGLCEFPAGICALALFR
jgi:hypothetical protein